MSDGSYTGAKFTYISTVDSNLQHFVFVQDGSGNDKLYKNGTLVYDYNEPAALGVGIRSYPLQIGGSVAFSIYFNGKIDEVMIFDQAFPSRNPAALFHRIPFGRGRRA